MNPQIFGTSTFETHRFLCTELSSGYRTDYTRRSKSLTHALRLCTIIQLLSSTNKIKMNALLNKTIQNGTRRLHNRKQFLGQPASKFFQQCLEKTVQKCCVSVYMLKRTTVFGADMIENTMSVGPVHVLLYRFYPDFIQILFRFYPDFLKTNFIQISSRFYPAF